MDKTSLFTAASFTISTAGTIVSVLGVIRSSGEDDEPRFAGVGWILLASVLTSYVLGIVSLFLPDRNLPGILPATSTLPAVLALVVGTIGVLGCAYLTRIRRWRSWALAGVVLIPLVTVAGVGYYLAGS